MYKLARKPVPQYEGNPEPTTPVKMNVDIKVPGPRSPEFHPPSPSDKPHFRVFTNLNEVDITHLRFSQIYDTTYRPNMGKVVTGTQDLADFLKTSKPEDFAISLNPADDASVSGSSLPKKRRFLRTPPSKELTDRAQVKATTPLSLPHVVSKTTSTGKPYLQIHVDYTEANPSESLADTTTNHNAATDFCRTNSHNQDSTVQQASHLHDSAADPFPPPWGPMGSKRPESGNRGSSNTSQELLQKVERRIPILPSISTNMDTSSRHHQPHEISLASPTSSYHGKDRSSLVSVDVTTSNSSPTHRSSVATLAATPYPKAGAQGQLPEPPACLDSAMDIHEKQGHVSTLHEQTGYKFLPSPGPPPSRSLPSLPEPLTSANSSSLCEGNGAFGNDRRRREERVKARKARDMKEMQRQKLQESIRLLDADTEAKERTLITSHNSLRPSEAIRRPTQDSYELYCERPISPRTTGAASPGQRNQEHLQSHDAPTPPRSPSSLVSAIGGNEQHSVRTASRNTGSSMSRRLSEIHAAKVLELEQRLQLLEQKHMILEQAFITMLQRTSPHRSQSNSIENLLADFRITYPCPGWIESHPVDQHD